MQISSTKQMKKALKIIGIGLIILLIGGLGSLLVDHVIFTKLITHPTWSQNKIIQALDSRIKIIKTTEKVIVENSESIADIASTASGTVVYVENINPDGTVVSGNGIIISGDGVIATDASIVPEDETMFVFVKLANGQVYDVKDVYIDEYSNIAFIKIDAQNLATVSFANSDDARSGKRLIAIARNRSSDDALFALGGLFGYDNIFSINEPTSDFLQGVLSIDFSNTVLNQSIGSPVVDFNGNVVGLISMKKEKDENIFYAVAANDIYKAFENFLQNNSKEETSEDIVNNFGVNYEIITNLDVYMNELGINNGAIIKQPETYADQSTFANTLAAKNGIKGGDIVVMVNNHVIDNDNNLSRLLNENEDVSLKIMRGDELLTIELER